MGRKSGAAQLERAMPSGGDCSLLGRQCQRPIIMTISPEISFLSEIQNSETLSVGTLAYFRQRLRNRLYGLVLTEFLKQESEDKVTKAKIARRTRRTNPAQITRWLAAPSNWTIDTISDLMVAMGTEPGLSIVRLVDQPTRVPNDASHEWLDVDPFQWVEKQRTGAAIQPPEDQSAPKVTSDPASLELGDQLKAAQ